MRPTTLILAAVAIVSASVAAAPPAQATMCIGAWWSHISIHGRFATEYYAAEFPLTSFSTKGIGSNSLRTMVLGYLANGTDCDSFTGAVTSTTSLALSPVMPTSLAWIDASATADELSDSDTHPVFNRAIPTDSFNAGAVATLALDFGWETAIVLCEDDAYGRSVTDGFSQTYTSNGGTIDFSRCFTSNTPQEELETLIETALASSKSRVIFLGGVSDSMREALVTTRAADRAFLLAPEEVCTSTSTTTTGDIDRAFPGLICGTYSIVADRAAAYNAAFAARDPAADIATFPYQFTAETMAGIPSTNFYGAMQADATRALMKALYTYPDANQTLYPDVASFIPTVVVPDGLTGYVSFKANGDRESARLVMLNVQPRADNESAAHLVSIGSYDAGRYARNGSLYFPAVGFTDGVPSGLKPIPEEKPPFPWWAVIVAVLVLLVIVIFAVRTAKAKMALARCPLDAAQPFATVFVSVKNEDAVRDTFPSEASAAFSRIAGFVRKAARANDCHEARRVDETTVMVVAKSAAQAARFATAVMVQADAEPWSDTLCGAPSAQVAERRANDDRTVASSRRTRQSARSGAKSTARSGKSAKSHDTSFTVGSSVHSKRHWPQLNIGVHYGIGVIDHDDETGALSYHGAVVDVAARVVDAGVGDHIVVSQPVADEIELATNGTVEDLVSGGCNLYEFKVIQVRGAAVAPAFAANGSSSAQQPLGLHTLMPQSFSAEGEVIARAQNVADHAADSADDVGGSVASALSQADNGFSRRRVSGVVLMVPGLTNARSQFSDGEHTKRLTQMMEEIADAADRHKARVVSVVDGRVAVAINSTGPLVSMPEARAARLAHYLAVELPLIDRAFRGTTAGLTSGRSMEGSAWGVRASVGTVMTTARIMQQAAAHLGVPILSSDHAIDDLCATCETVPVDAVALPTGCRGTAGDKSVPTRVTRLISVLSPRDEAADGEWLYHMQATATPVPDPSRPPLHGASRRGTNASNGGGLSAGPKAIDGFSPATAVAGETSRDSILPTPEAFESNPTHTVDIAWRTLMDAWATKQAISPAASPAESMPPPSESNPSPPGMVADAGVSGASMTADDLATGYGQSRLSLQHLRDALDAPSLAEYADRRAADLRLCF